MSTPETSLDPTEGRKTGRGHRRAFLMAWVRSPRMVGAVAPSGRPLTREMARQVRKDHNSWVVEVGAGTGAVTRAILDAGVDPARMLVIERDPLLCHRLTQRFPKLHVVHDDAIRLRQILEERQIGNVHAIVSGIPLLTIPRETMHGLVSEMAHCLAPDGQIIQFTYGPQSAIPRCAAERFSLASTRITRIWRNFPPASIWVYRKRES